MRLFETNSIVLASQSPRRMKLLRNIGLVFSVFPSSFDESSIDPMDPEDYVKILSLCKAEDVAKHYPDSWIIGADTIVSIDNNIIGKPLNRENAVSTLERLSGRVHQVYTGYTIKCTSKKIITTKAVSTDVEFKKVHPNEIDYYVATGESFDKSGGYAIQGIGAFLIKKIKGSYSSVMGLPMCEIVEDLTKLNIITIK